MIKRRSAGCNAYSVLSVSTGFAEVARRAGNQEANGVTRARSTGNQELQTANIDSDGSSILCVDPILSALDDSPPMDLQALYPYEPTTCREPAPPPTSAEITEILGRIDLFEMLSEADLE
jgi:hypothetical protein